MHSVGPYPLSRRRGGDGDVSTLLMWAGWSASPPTASDVSPPNSPGWTRAWWLNSEVDKNRQVIDWSAIRCSSRSWLSRSSVSMTTIVAPLHSATQISQVVASNIWFEAFPIRSPASIWSKSRSSTSWSTPRWVVTTAFG